MTDLATHAREIIESNQYLTLATADADGCPWASPVWFAHDGYTHFLWVSRPGARHSRNLSIRPQVGIVIFDSAVPPGGAQAVYVAATAEELTGEEAERSVAIFSSRSQAAGAREWTVKAIRPPEPHRLYRASASAQFVLGDNDERIALSLG